MNKGWFYILGMLIGVYLITRMIGLDHYITIQRLQEHSQYWTQLVERNYFKAIIVYTIVTVSCVLVGIPAVMPLALLAGLLFGTYQGILYTMLGIIIASLLIFYLVQHVLKSYFYHHYAKSLEKVSSHSEKMGISYFLILYFSSIIPTLCINILAALSGISLPVFVGITIVGSLPVVTVFAMAGSRFNTIQSVYDIFSPGIILIFFVLLILACFPWIMRWYNVHILHENK